MTTPQEADSNSDWRILKAVTKCRLVLLGEQSAPVTESGQLGAGKARKIPVLVSQQLSLCDF